MITKKAYNESDFRRLINNKYADHVILMEPIETLEPLHWTQPKKISRDNPAVYWKYLTFHGANARYEDARTEDANDHSAIIIPADATAGLYIMNGFALIGNPKTFTTYNQSSAPWLVDGLQSGLKAACSKYKTEVQITNSMITGFNWGAYWHYDVGSSILLNSILIGGNNEYFNYAPWLGGRGNAINQDLTMINCTIDKVRHAVGASGHLNNYYALNNTIISTIKHAFDRHEHMGYGGKNTVIVGNTLLNPDRYGFSIKEPNPTGMFVYKGNKHKRTKSNLLGEVSWNDGSKSVIGDPGIYQIPPIGAVSIDISQNQFGI